MFSKDIDFIFKISKNKTDLHDDVRVPVFIISEIGDLQNVEIYKTY